jgi:trehalose-6-phosphate synthase
MISEIKAHIEQNNIGREEDDQKMNFNFPVGADLQALKGLAIDRSTEDRIIAKVLEELDSKRSLIVSLDQKDLLQVVGDATAASMIAIAEADGKKAGNP